jgi:NhaP-type Na+/H+ or K+/H+ antiporter
MHYKLIIDDQISLDQLQKQVEKGGTFVMYQYCISILLVLSLRRFSPAYFIPANESKSKYKAKYNRLSSIFGWWGIPRGIVYTLSSYKINRNGGIDVTEDILYN